MTGVSFWLRLWTIQKKDPVFTALFTPLTLIITVTFSAFLWKEILHLGRFVLFNYHDVIIYWLGLEGVYTGGLHNIIVTIIYFLILQGVNIGFLGSGLRNYSLKGCGPRCKF